MASELKIICTIERLPALDSAAGLGFGLNFTVGWGEAPLAAFEQAMKPWDWNRIGQIRYHWLKADGTALPPNTVNVIPQTGVPTRRQPAAFIRRLNELYTSSAGDPNNLLWPQSQYRLNDKENARPWHALLKHVSTYPFPLAQCSNTSHLFRVPREADGVDLVAAPIIPKATETGATFPPETLTPASTATATPDRPKVFKWVYDVTTPFQTLAFFEKVSIDVESLEMFNFTTQWLDIKATSRNAAFATDWQSDFENRVARGFHLSQFLAGFLTTEKYQDVLSTEGNAAKVVALALASLRDVADLGISPDPNDVVLGLRLIIEANLTGPDVITPAELSQLTAALPAIRDALFQGPNGLQDWATFLNSNLPSEARDLSILKGPPIFPVQATTIRVGPREAIDQLEKVFALSLNTKNEDSSLWLLFRKQWEKALKQSGLPDALQAKINKALAKAESEAAGLDLSHQLLLSNLGRFWPQLISSGVNTDALGHDLVRQCLPDFIRFYARIRLGLTGPPGTCPDTPTPAPVAGCTFPTLSFAPAIPADLIPDGALLTKLKEALECWIADTMKELSLSPTPTVTEVPHAITFQAGKVTLENTAAPDPLERIAGIGVLMRETGKQWRPLNLGFAFTGDPPEGAGDPLIRDPLLVPYRFHYRSGVRQISFSYNNQPLIARGPLAGASITNLNSTIEGSNPLELTAYKYAPTARMPGLKFGANYEFALFAISNSGVIPAALASADSPCRFNPAAPAPPDEVISVPIPYRRLVRVGAPRLFNNAAESGVRKFRPLELPKLPDKVTPLARDIESLYEEGDPNLVDRRRDQAIVLLTPGDWVVKGVSVPNKYEFRAKLPATSWECWDRWVMGVNSADPRRQPVITDYFRKARANELASPGQEIDLQFDDPAIRPELFFLLDKARPDGTLENKGFVRVAMQLDTIPANNDLVRVQRKAILVRCEYQSAPGTESVTEQPAAGSEPRHVLVKVVEGEVYRLTMCSAVDTGDIAKFGERVLDRIPTPAGVPWPNLQLVSPTRLIIEAATAKLPVGEDIWANLTTDFRQAPNKVRSTELGKNWRLRAEIRNLGNNHRYVHRAEIDRQVWRWTGRTSKEHPELLRDFTPAQENDRRKAHRDWEALEFGERSDSDLVTHNMLSEKKPAVGERLFFFEEVLGDAGSGEHHGLELRGLHFRFAVRVFSRYEQLIPPQYPASVTSEKEISEPEFSRKTKFRWKSQFVPCRHTKNLEAPKIKFMLPLTENVSDQPGNTGGILVVLSEVWHQRGGIGEGIEAEVVMSPDPREPPSLAQKFYFQIGPDPIVTEKGRHQDNHPIDHKTFRFGNLRGPVGHFYDVLNRSADFTNTAAFFVNTSFVLPPPTMDVAGGGTSSNFPWHFAKIRLRRTLLTRIPVDSTAAGSGFQPDERFWKVTRIASEYTDPVWVQFLPDFSIFDQLSEEISELKLIVSDNESEVVLRNSSGNNAVLKEFASDNHSFSLYLVLTKKVFDGTGRNDQEAYVALYKQDDKGIWKLDAQTPSLVTGQTTTQDYIARIIEVQTPDLGAAAGCSTATGLWETLFSKSHVAQNQCDTKARIVRISRPIETGGQFVPDPICR